MRVYRYFAFVDLTGFTNFTATHGDEKSVEVLTTFRNTVRTIGTDFGVRIAKWLGDGCMFVAIEPRLLLAAVLGLMARIRRTETPLKLRAGIAGGSVILLEGDDYVGSAVNLASRLCDMASPNQLLSPANLASLAPTNARAELIGPVEVNGFLKPISVVQLDLATESAIDTSAARPPQHYSSQQTP